MTKKGTKRERNAKAQAGARGGEKRALNLSPEERQEASRRASLGRWAQQASTSDLAAIAAAAAAYRKSIGSFVLEAAVEKARLVLKRLAEGRP
jgi:hypothetical protein